MFSTFLKEITGYFDKNAIISAFFPNLVFWGMTLLVYLSQQRSYQKTIGFWNSTDAVGQFLYLLGFFVWIAFCSFLTLNFHSTFQRFFEGEWHVTSLVWLSKWRWEKRWEKLKRKELDLKKRYVELDVLLKVKMEDIKTSVVAKRTKLENDKYKIELESREKLQVLEQEITGHLESISKSDTLKNYLNNSIKSFLNYIFRKSGNSTKQKDKLYFIKATSDKLYSACDLFVISETKQSNVPSRFNQNELKKELTNLAKRAGKFKDIIKRERNVIEEKRFQIQHKLYLKFPREADDLRATELGNVSEASESRIRLRYNLDAPVFWSRLQPLLKEDETKPIQDIKTSLNLMLTSALGIILFGFPLSIYIILFTDYYFLGIVPLVFGGINFFIRQYKIAVVCFIAWIVPFFFSLESLDGILDRFGLHLLPMNEILTILITFGGLSILAGLCYRNAVESNLVYAEKLQSAFDLHRWRIFDALKLQYPPNIKEERKIWGDLGQLIYRGYDPHKEVFRYLVDEKKTMKPIEEAKTSNTIVLRKRFPSFHEIEEEDIAEIVIPDEKIPHDSVSDKNELIGKILLTDLGSNQPIRKSYLGDRKNFKDHVSIGLNTSAENVHGGHIETGDVVDIWINPKSEKKDSKPLRSAEPIHFSDVIVLDVISKTKGSRVNQTEDTVSGLSDNYVIVVALPIDKVSEKKRSNLANKLAGANILIANKIANS